MEKREQIFSHLGLAPSQRHMAPIEEAEAAKLAKKDERAQRRKESRAVKRQCRVDRTSAAGA